MPLSQLCSDAIKRRRPRNTAICDQVFAAYSIPLVGRYHFGCDQRIPIALSGASTAANLWPLPNIEAKMKARLETGMQRRACVAYSPLTPGDAAKVLADEQREIANDWPAAHRRYIGRRAVANFT